ncbi:MAG: helicase SNF2 [Bacteroidetes bacterium]|nr:MAG: helicase SNF2 [Bacteroidota bacterium]TAF91848.1 MAG: helicase SNF2 [Bacteroidota bacterium]
MALSHLVKYVYNNGSEDVIRRGKKIYHAHQVELLDFNDLLGSVQLRVKDDSYSLYYKVVISQLKDAKEMQVRCSCPYNMGEVCRHKAAALLYVQELVDTGKLGSSKTGYNQQHTVVKIKQLELRSIKPLCSTDSFQEASEFVRVQKAEIISAEDEKVVAEITMHGLTNKVVIHKNAERNLDTSCTCDSEPNHPLCVHKAAVLLQLMHKGGANYFDSIKNWDKDKNKLLALYGYSLSDNLKGKFEFIYNNGRPSLRLLDASIKRVAAPPPTEPKPEAIAVLPVPEAKPEKAAAVVTQKGIQRVGMVLRYNALQYPFLELDAVLGTVNDVGSAFIDKVEKIDLAKYVPTETLEEEDAHLVQQLRKLLSVELGRYIERNAPFSIAWNDVIHQHTNAIAPETKQLVAEYYYPKIKKIFEENTDNPLVYYLPDGKPFTTANLQRVNLVDKLVAPEIVLQRVADGFAMQVEAKLPEGNRPLTDNELPSPFLFKYYDNIYLWENVDCIQLIEEQASGANSQVPTEHWSSFLLETIVPLTKQYNVNFTNIPKREMFDLEPETKIELMEQGDFLLFHPVYNYLGYEIKNIDKEKVIIPVDNQIILLHRNHAAEQKALDFVKGLHSNFIWLADKKTLALKGIDVLKNNWFFLFIDAVKEKQMAVLGFDALRNFRFNTYKPNTKIYISSRTDWFDAKVDIFFGEQKVTVADVKKALANKQQFVVLNDGTLGILPEEWIKKYSLLFRVGEGKQANLKLSKYHFSVIEELYEQRDEEELIFQLEEKYEKLKELSGIQSIEAPLHLQNTLRPYQLSGFQWLNYLHNVQWGGILADDMGLGKTIQALCFMNHLREKNESLKALVVCPTTLLFNWENEIKKFTPSLQFHVHHGATRDKKALHNIDNEVIITTYGTLRSDIKLFIDINFDYVVLDESQAIKNPNSKVAKAAVLLQAKNKLCLSGTPLQNNTFDIYAQMNFLNPGMLGSVEFFKQEFAVPIDKFGEKEQKEHLRRLLYPFILRRTKEQVAKDLPPKTEMILFCEMGDEQRNIYNAYRNEFRDKIMGVVAEQGIQRSQLTILQGLMKLRQICDSPAIMNEEERFPNVSVKLDELTREIEENISNHKALVFSQFLGMLAIIRQRLNELNIPYAYFDGSTSTADREKAIQKFQENDECRVFLISLKAGGVGLNLTAADYVYIVDPWWNPAVEQQAIDRTHRIGQTKNIFAYRMICKDTVEDKILKLQEKKKVLATELITDDTGFVKSLTKEDIEYLFS